MVTEPEVGLILGFLLLSNGIIHPGCFGDTIRIHRASLRAPDSVPHVGGGEGGGAGKAWPSQRGAHGLTARNTPSP